MQISVTEEGVYSVIVLSGKLDTDTAVKADSVFSEALNKRNHLLVDPSDFSYQAPSERHLKPYGLMSGIQLIFSGEGYADRKKGKDSFFKNSQIKKQ